MEDYLHKLKHSIRLGGGGASLIKRLFAVAVIVCITGVIIIVVLAVLAFNWLTNRGDDIRHMGRSLTDQTQAYVEPLTVQSYLHGGQVDAARLQETFNRVPAGLQGIWLDRLQKQIDDLRTQAGVSDETVHTLTSLYDSFKQTQK